MPDINFPSSPSGGDIYTFNNISYTWDGEKWTAKAPVTTTSTYGDANVAAYSSAQGFIDLQDLSVTSNSPSGNGSLSYNNSSGVFTFTPADASGSGGGSYANSDVEAYISGGDGIDFASGVIDVDSTVVRTTGSQSIAGTKTFTNLVYLTDSGNTGGGGALTVNGELGVAGSSGNHFINVGGSNPKLRLFEAGRYVALKPPSGIDIGNVEWFLPPSDGSNGQAIVTDGSGNLSFATVASAYGNTEVQAYLDEQGYSNTAVSSSGETTFTADVKFDTGVEEKFHTYSSSSGVTAFDCDNGHIHYVTSPSGDITANFTNLGLTAEYTTNLTVIINQGATAREVTAVQIGGSAQTINWQGGVAPTGTDNGIDAFSFTILNDGGSYVVLGQMVDFT